MDRKAMYKLSYGLFILTAKEAEKDNGCIINTAIQAASEPNQLSICVNKANYTHDMIQRTGKFTVSVLSQKAQFELFKHFGFQSGRDTNKFEAFEQCARGTNGIYYITEGTNAYISVTVTKTEDLGSHTMFIGEITDMEVLSNVPSVTYDYYQNNIKPKPQEVGKTEDTIKNYLEYIQQTYLISQLFRYDPSVKKQMMSPKKIYFVDNAIIKRIGFNATENNGVFLENLVFIELKRRGWDVYYYADKKECDFIVRKGLHISDAYQVTLKMDSPQTREREIAGVREAMQAYSLSKGYILTFEGKETINFDDGTIVEVVPVWEWILQYKPLS